MTQYDWLLIFLGIGIVVFFTFQRMVRGLFSLAVLWSVTLASAVLYREAAFRVQAVAGKNPSLVQGVMFDLLLVVFFVGGYVILKLAFPVTKLPKLGVLDNLMGMLLGAIVAAVLIALLVNSMGVMIGERWETNPQGWGTLRASYYGSGLRGYTTPVLSVYSWAFYPFFGRIPPILVPQ